jgi:hypothetical protein
MAFLNKYSILIIIVAVAIAGIATVFVFARPPDNGGPDDGINARIIHKEKSGLFFSDSLKDDNQTMVQISQESDDMWVFAGSALSRGSPVDYYQVQGKGLYVGVENAGVVDEWAGIFAMTDDDYAMLYHTVITVPDDSISTNQNFNVGMYIQTDVLYGVINYVGCVVNLTPRGPIWAVESGLGNATQVTERNVLWRDVGTNQTTSRDCTIVTNGQNHLAVYFDSELVYSNEELDLKMPRPFNAYLETQVINSDSKVYGLFSDYYSTLNEKIKVVKAPPGGIVQLLGDSDKVLQTATATDNGIAIFNVGQYHYPLSARIVVLDDDRKIVAYTPDPIQIFGGDVYAADTLGPFDRGLLEWEQ